MLFYSPESEIHHNNGKQKRRPECSSKQERRNQPPNLGAVNDFFIEEDHVVGVEHFVGHE